MTRRLFGPVSGPIAFFLVAALVFAGLGWVTYSALGVERSQRESAARAEMGNNLRVALWQLDSRMLPALGVEDSRPYYHYAPADPAATPLFVANLADWMKLHFQLDPATGWTSPLVPDPVTCQLVREAWAEVSPHNMSSERAQVLNDLKFRCPAQATYDLFATTDRSIPSDSFSLAAPLVAGDVQTENSPPPIPPSPNDAPAKPAPTNQSDSYAKGVSNRLYTVTTVDVVRIFGIELCFGPNGSPTLARRDNLSQAPKYHQKYSTPGQALDNPRGMSQGLGAGPRSGNRLAQKDSVDNEKQVADWMNRAGLIDRAFREAKNAAEFQMPKGQLLNNYGQNYLPNIEARNSANTANTANPPGGNKTGGPTPPMPTSPPSVIIGGGATVLGKSSDRGPGPTDAPRDDKAINDSLRKPGNLADGTPRRTTPESFARNSAASNELEKRRSLHPLEAACLGYELSNWFRQHNRSEPATHARRGCRANPEGRQASRPRDTSRTGNRSSGRGTPSSPTGDRSAGRGGESTPRDPPRLNATSMGRGAGWF